LLEVIGLPLVPLNAAVMTAFDPKRRSRNVSSHAAVGVEADVSADGFH